MDVDPTVVTEVPQALKTLVRYMMRGFYSQEHAIVAEMLMHHPCIKEDDLLDLLKFDRKQLRSVISSLKHDLFLKTRLRVETDAEGHTTKHNFYFIAYSVMVNVIKYKLDIMRHQIETEERDMSNRASFVCPNKSCQTQFTDLDVGLLIDMSTGLLRCTMCQEEINDDGGKKAGATDGPDGPVVVDQRTRIKKFNEMTAPLYELLHKVEDVKLHSSILEPEPKDMKSARSQGGARGTSQGWSGDATRNNGISYENTVTICTNESEMANNNGIQKKEAPIWMQESTIQDAFNGRAEKSTDKQGSVSKGEKYAASKGDRHSAASKLDAASRQNDDDIMRTLLMVESKKKQDRTVPSQSSVATTDPWGNPSASAWGNEEPESSKAYDASSSDSEDDESSFAQPRRQIPPPVQSASAADVEMADQEGDEDVVMVTVGGVQYSYEEAADMVDRMTETEKAEYVRLGQELYEDMFE